MIIKKNDVKCSVRLLTHTPEPEKYIAAAAKLCYSASDIKSLLDDLTPKKVETFVSRLESYGHESPFEHVSFTFGIEGVSRSLTHQLVRHRIGASYSQKSQRYVTEGQFEYIIPPKINENLAAKKIFLDAMQADQVAYDKIVFELLTGYLNQAFKDSIKYFIYCCNEPKCCDEVWLDLLIKKSENDKELKTIINKCQKKAIEDARFVMPNACESKIVVTMNARALFNFFTLRCCERAQWEIRDMALEMLKCVKDISPIIFAHCGPSCVRGSCKEGNMGCGKAKEMKKKFLG